jgi:hypothetical protein
MLGVVDWKEAVARAGAAADAAADAAASAAAAAAAGSTGGTDGEPELGAAAAAAAALREACAPLAAAAAAAHSKASTPAAGRAGSPKGAGRSGAGSPRAQLSREGSGSVTCHHGQSCARRREGTAGPSKQASPLHQPSSAPLSPGPSRQQHQQHQQWADGSCDTQEAGSGPAPDARSSGGAAGTTQLRAAVPLPLRLPRDPSTSASDAASPAALGPAACDARHDSRGAGPSEPSSPSACPGSGGQGNKRGAAASPGHASGPHPAKQPCQRSGPSDDNAGPHQQAPSSPPHQQGTPAGHRALGAPWARGPDAASQGPAGGLPDSGEAAAAAASEEATGSGAAAVLGAQRRVAEMDGLCIGSAVCIADLIRQVCAWR